MRLVKGLTGSVIKRLTIIIGGEDDRKDAHFLIGQECLGLEKKTPMEQEVRIDLFQS